MGEPCIAAAIDAVSDAGETVIESTDPADQARGSIHLGPAERYVVLEEIGAGATGRAFRAYDAKLHREVALKEVRAEAVTNAAVQQLMAQLIHPNVVALYDVVERPEGVMLAMERVTGTSLQAWLRSHEGTGQGPRRQELLGWLLAAGDGLDAAHACGLLHRDFKPANVLLGDDGRVKITDFGLAQFAHCSDGAETNRASRPSTSEPAPVDAEAPVVASDPLRPGIGGTSRYMAPEQHRGEPCTAAVDQYAWCVVLWEALCGAPPFGDEPVADLRARKEAGPPPWPKHGGPRALGRTLRRGLAPDPQDRWPSLAQLLVAVRRASGARRRRARVAATALGLLVGAGLPVQGWVAARAQRCGGAPEHLSGTWDADTREQVRRAMARVPQAYARPAWEHTAAALDQYAADWTAAYRDACEATAVRGEQAEQVLDLRMGCLHRGMVEWHAAVEVLVQADAQVVQKAHEVVAALMPVHRCADVAALQAGDHAPLPGDAAAVEQGRAHLAAARSLVAAGRYTQARGTVEEAAAALQDVDYPPIQLERVLLHGHVLDVLGEYGPAEALWREGLHFAARQRRGQDLGTAAYRLLGLVGGREQRMAESQPYQDLAAPWVADDPEAEGRFLGNVGSVLANAGRLGEAEEKARAALAKMEAALGPEHVRVAGFRDELGVALARQGKIPAAEQEFRVALAARERLLGADHPDVATTHNNLGALRLQQGQYAAAELEFRDALAIKLAALGAEHATVAGTRSNLGAALAHQGQYEAAAQQFQIALAIFERVFGRQHPHVVRAYNNLGKLRQDQGRTDEAEAMYRKALEIALEAFGHEHSQVAFAQHNLGGLLVDRGQFDAGEAAYLDALRLREKFLSDDAPELAMTRSSLASLWLDQGRLYDALVQAERAWERRQVAGVPAEDRAFTAFVLARILWAIPGPLRDRTRAIFLAELALAGFHEGDMPNRVYARDVEQWLRAHKLGRRR